MDFMKLAGKRILVFGVANKKSVAYHVAKSLIECGAEVVFVVRSPARKESTAKLLAGHDVFVCDVEHEDQIQQLAEELAAKYDSVHDLLHSIAFAKRPVG